MLFIIACIVSFIPYTALFLWLRNIHKEDAAYRTLCNKTLGYGALCVLPVVLFSGVSYVLLRLTRIHTADPFLYQVLYDLVVIAFMEELAKYLMFKRALKKTDHQCSWMDLAVLMTIIGIGFGFLEAIIYAIGASIPVVLVRGICLPHAGYGFIVGYFYGKAIKYEKHIYKWTGFLISWLIHGLYDFSLSEEFVALNDNLVIAPVLLALLDIVLVIRLIVFVKKAKRNTTGLY